MKNVRYALIAALSLLGVGVVLWSTARYGVGVSPDSTGYLSAAHNLLAGEGLRRYDGDWYSAWPPLFPLCLAALGLTGADPAVAARFLNAFALGGITFVAGLLLERSLRSKCLVIIGAAAVLLCSLLLGIANMAWSEPVFVLLIVLFVFSAPAFLQEPRLRSLVTLSLLVALCCMQRYTGVALVAGGAILILAFPFAAGLRRRIGFLALFLAISCTPSALWAVRNYKLTSMFSGIKRVPSIYSLGANVTYALDTASQWFVPAGVPLPLRAGLVGLFLLLSIIAVVLGRKRLGGSCPFVWPLAVVALTYLPLMVYTHQVGVLDETLNDRYLSPISVLTVCFLFIGMDRAASLLRGVPQKGRMLAGMATVLLALWLICPAAGVWKSALSQRRAGAGGYSVTSWQESPLVNWLREHRLDGSLYSNAPDAIYALTGLGARASLWRSDDPAVFRARLSAGRNPHLVWFRRVQRPYTYDLDELISMFRLEPVAAVRDGAVYRFWAPDERTFPAGRIFSPCAVRGKWSRTFTSDKFGARGLVTSWTMKADGTTDSTWVLDTGNDMVLRWRVSCPYTHTGGEFEFRSEGQATQDGTSVESPCTLTVRGTIDANTATGTYRIEFANPQWPADRGTWRVELAHPVYRFYNKANDRHLYVNAAKESPPGKGWINEGVAWYAYQGSDRPFDAQPVYEFHSATGGDVFYTLSEREKTKLLDDPAHPWTYEGIARYALGPSAE